MTKHFIDRDKVMDRREFYRLPRTDQRSQMATWRLTKTTEQIKKEMNLSTTAFYALLKRLDLPTNLKEYRDSQPSLLNEDSYVKTNLATSNFNTVTESASVGSVSNVGNNNIQISINIAGKVSVADLTTVLEFVKQYNLELSIKS